MTKRTQQAIENKQSASARSYLPFAALWLLSIPLLWGPLREMVALSLDDGRYSHLILIPLISAFFLYRERRRILAGARFSPRPGIALVCGALALYAPFAAGLLQPGPAYRLSVLMLSVWLVWAAAFALGCGVPSARAAKFPLLLLLLLVPVPSPWMDGVIALLQRGSAEASYFWFQLLGTPMFRDGVRFELPGVSIEVAAECSSIHSCWALFITGILVGHLFLKSLGAKVCLSALTIPIAMFTNAVRIVTLWLLATKVDMGFMYGDLHHRGGALFSVVSLSFLLGCVLVVRKLEGRGGLPRVAVEAAACAPSGAR